MRIGKSRDSVDRGTWVASLKGQHLETVPSIDTLGRTQSWFTPFGLNLWAVLTTVDFDIAK